MNMPGFTAEAALPNVSGRYQANTATVFDGGIVQPAGDMYIPHDPPRVTPDRSVYHPRPLYCLKTLSLLGPNGGWTTLKVLGFWNPVTGRCE